MHAPAPPAAPCGGVCATRRTASRSSMASPSTLGAGPPALILGPNGAGKSVLLRLLHGLLRPSAGAVRWAGPRRGRARQAMVFQRPVMLRRSALANVAYALKLAGVPRAERLARAVGAGACRPGRPRGPAGARLSGGEQQRLALARASALGPRSCSSTSPARASIPRPPAPSKPSSRASPPAGPRW